MKQSITKTNLFLALFATTLFSTVATAAVPKTTLVAAEPVNQTQFTAVAHNHLKAYLKPAKMVFTQQPTNTGIVEQKQTANQNMSVTLTNVSLMAE